MTSEPTDLMSSTLFSMGSLNNRRATAKEWDRRGCLRFSRGQSLLLFQLLEGRHRRKKFLRLSNQSLSA